MPPKKAQAKPETEEDEEDSSEEEEEKATPAKKDTKEFKPPPRTEGDSGAGDSGAKADAEKDDAAPKAPPKPFSVEFTPHRDDPAMEAPLDVEYCPTCGLPPDFCQYGPSWEKCKPWALQHYPKYYPELSGVSIEEAKKGKEAAEEKDSSKVKELPGGKKKRAASPHVTIKKLSRGGRKCVTCVTGLEGFGVNLDSAAKFFKKKLACGVAVVKGDPGQPDSVDIQGDFEEELIDLCEKEYKEIPRAKFTIVEGGTKKKGKGR
uniref:SUI1 domain-containing protein n=1 Tax=Zooxanthella nutricula TaxID=1333877 RepID=A0A7S2LRU2_9DINO